MITTQNAHILKHRCMTMTIAHWEKGEKMEGQEWNEYMKVYMRDNYVHATVCLRKGRDDDIIEFLKDLENKSDYLRDLIRKDMKKWRS